MNENTDEKIFAKAAFIEYLHNIDLQVFKDVAADLDYQLNEDVGVMFADGGKRCTEMRDEVDELIYRFEQLQKNDLKFYVEFTE
jgi:hypothetical protein